MCKQHNQSIKEPNRIYWMPENARETVQRVGVISLVKGQQLTHQLYWLLLSERVQELIDKAVNEDEPLSMILDWLSQPDLLNLPDGKPGTAEYQKKMGEALILQNGNMQLHLTSLGVPGSLPQKPVMKSTPGAQMMYESLTIENFLTALLIRPAEPLR